MSFEDWVADGLSVVIPVFNEEDGISPTVAAIQQALRTIDLPHEIIVVDDGSTDGTADAASRLVGVKLIRHRENRGVGAARNTGILAANYGAIAMLDGDGTYPAAELPNMLEGLSYYHMVVGARTGKKVARNPVRAVPKWFILKLATYISGKSIPDLNSGLRVFRKESAQRFFHILPQGHSWVTTITLAMLSNGLPVQFIPVDYYKRIGKSTFHPLLDTYNYVLLIIKTVMYFNPIKVFFPAGLLLFIIGLAKLLYNNYKYNDIRESDVILIVVSLLLLFQGLLADLIVARTKLRGTFEEHHRSWQ